MTFHSMSRHASFSSGEKDLRDNDLAKPQYFVSKQDNFDSSNTKTWNQAYYVNDTYWDASDDSAPVFLCVGGEGPPLDGSVVKASPHCNIAVEWLQEKKALMFAVEHRYYGCHNASACPYAAGDAHPLKYLSSRQALADLATFHSFAIQKYGLKPTNKWVSFGGSYPGMLAGWFRLVHPELVHASVASSAPVLAKLDMRGYNDVVAEAYAVESVGGSKACSDAIAAGHAKIGSLMNTTEGRKQLEHQFGVSSLSLISRAGKRAFAGEGVAYFPAQGNDPSCSDPGCNIEEVCKIMTSTGADEVQRLAWLRHNQSSMFASLNAEGRKHSKLILDYWGWQTCTEFGFYQTCEVGSKCFFTQGLDSVEDEDAFCKPWGISTSDIQKNIDATNKFYGGLNPNATRILYPNGEVDPWHALSILKSPKPSIPTLWVKGASHHAWTHPSMPSDQPTVVAARAAIRKQVEAWLDE